MMKNMRAKLFLAEGLTYHMDMLYMCTSKYLEKNLILYVHNMMSNYINENESSYDLSPNLLASSCIRLVVLWMMCALPKCFFLAGPTKMLTQL